VVASNPPWLPPTQIAENYPKKTIVQLQKEKDTMWKTLKSILSKRDSQRSNIDSDLPKTPMTAQDFRKRLEAGERRFERLLLANIDLRGLDLTNLVLTDSELIGCDLSYTCLLYANFSRSILDFSNAKHVFAEGSNFSEASLVGCNLSQAYAAHVNFSNANLSQSNFTWADLRGANLADANLSQVNLATANLDGANLENTAGKNMYLKMLRLSVGSSVIRRKSR
jgi:uncharacterized protein YjbI with pentapeptide repeats